MTFFMAFRYNGHMLIHEIGLATWNTYLIVFILIQELSYQIFGFLARPMEVANRSEKSLARQFLTKHLESTLYSFKNILLR